MVRPIRLYAGAIRNPALRSRAVSMTGLSSTTVSAVKVSPYTNHTVYFGGGGSGLLPRLIKATSANATPVFTSIIGAGMQTSGTNISCVELGTDENNIIVSFSNYGVNNVWVTNNGGSTWTAIDGNLPDMPVRWVMFYPGDNTRAIIATETGIWQTELINGASTVWDPETGFPQCKNGYACNSGPVTTCWRRPHTDVVYSPPQLRLRLPVGP